MVTFFSILLAIACIIIIGAVLLQPAKSGASVLGGTSQSIFGSTGGTTFLFRVTMSAAVFVMAVCLFLSWYKVSSSKSSVIDDPVPARKVETPLSNPTAPTTQDKSAPVKSDAVPEKSETAPAAPTESKK